MKFAEQHSPVSSQAFEDRYRQNPDPWGYRSSSYEQRKYRITVDQLAGGRIYSKAFEPGCSIGELTARLAPHCQSLLAVDFSSTAVAAARVRCSGFTHVRVERADVRSALDEGPFDLIVFSELGYYFHSSELILLAGRLRSALTDSGELIAVHWRGRSQDHILHADEVHALLRQHLGLSRRRALIEPEFRLDHWSGHE